MNEPPPLSGEVAVFLFEYKHSLEYPFYMVFKYFISFILFSFIHLSAKAEIESAFNQPIEKEMTTQYIPTLGLAPIMTTFESQLLGIENKPMRMTAGPALSLKILFEKESFTTLIDLSATSAKLSKTQSGSQNILSAGFGFGGFNFDTQMVFYGELEYSMLNGGDASGSGVSLKIGTILPLSESVVATLEVKGGAYTAKFSTAPDAAILSSPLGSAVFSIGFPLGDKPNREWSEKEHERKTSDPFIY